MYQALYRQERPETFREVVGQEHIVKVLEHQLKTDTVGHAYLFCGTRGTGKTTIARLLAKGLNCLEEDVSSRPCGHCDNCESISNGTFVDVIELDAASNRGIDSVRELRDSVKYPPAVGRKKVYIIDEVHMMTAPAFNALLKTLEEPPENVVFLLATTDPQQLPQTILSRCQRLDFKRLGRDKLVDHYKRICQKHGVTLEDDAADILAANADGSVRDGLSLLEQCLASGEKVITEEVVLTYGGAISQRFLIELTDSVINGNVADGLSLINCQLEDGKESGQILKDWMSHFRNLMVTRLVNNPADIIQKSSESLEQLVEQSAKIDLQNITDGLMILAKAEGDSKNSSRPRIFLDIALMSLMELFGGRGVGKNIGAERTTKEATGLKEEKVCTQEKSIQASYRPVSQTVDEEPPYVNKEPSGRSAEVSTLKEDMESGNDGVDPHKAPESAEEYADIWSAICDMVIKERPSIGTLKGRAEITDISESTFVIESENQITAKRLTDGLALISEVATIVLGRPMKGRITVRGKPNGTSEEEQDDTLERLRELLGDIPISVE